MSTLKKEAATTRARLFPSTYTQARIEGAKSKIRLTVAQVVEGWRKEAKEIRTLKSGNK